MCMQCVFVLDFYINVCVCWFVGNLVSLKTIPKDKNINIHEAMKSFQKKYYVADKMTMSILAKGMSMKLNMQVVLFVIRALEFIGLKVFWDI